MGIVPGDPAYAFVQFMLRYHDDHAAEHQVHEARLAALLDRAETIAGGQLARTAAAALPGAIDRLVVRRHLWMVLATAGALVAMLLVGVGGGYWLRGGAPELICQDQNGGTVCFVWQRPPVVPTKGGGGA